MSQNRNKYEKARRRLAAVTFLTNISLDGSFKDTDLCQLLDKSSKVDKCDAGLKNGDVSYGLEKENIPRSSIRGRNKFPQSSPVNRMGGDNHSLSSDSEHSPATPVMTGVNQIRDRCQSGNAELYKEKHSSVRSRKAHLPSSLTQDDKSSTESLNIARFRTSNTCIPENYYYTKELRIVRATKGVTFKDERLAIAPNQGVPCALFSTIPYSKTIRSARSDIRKDGVRRRNTSGPRPLSSITDNGMDPFDLLGLEKEENGQDISYSKLLVPSRVTREQYRRMYINDIGDKASWKIVNRPPHIIARTKLLTRQKDKKW